MLSGLIMAPRISNTTLMRASENENPGLIPSFENIAFVMSPSSIIFAIALKFQDLYLFALLTMFFISLNFEDKNHCSLSNMYSSYLLLGISYISQWNEFQVLFRIRCGSYKGHVYNHYSFFVFVFIF